MLFVNEKKFLFHVTFYILFGNVLKKWQKVNIVAKRM